MSKPLRFNIISQLYPFLVTLCLAVVASLSSCQKELIYKTVVTDRKVEIAFSDVPYATMSTWLFSPYGGQLFYSLPTDRISTVDAPSSAFNALCYNDDSDINRFEIMSWDEATVTTGTTELINRSSFGSTNAEIPRGGDPDEPVLYQPTQLYADTCSMFTGNKLTFAPKAVLTAIEITVKEIENMQNISIASAALSGMSSEMNLQSLMPQGRACTIPIELSVSKDNKLTGSALSFGHCGEGARKHVLTIYFLLSDGQKIYYSYDVTDQLHTAHDHARIDLEVGKIKLPEVASEGGLNPQLDSWNTIEEDIAL